MWELKLFIKQANAKPKRRPFKLIIFDAIKGQDPKDSTTVDDNFLKLNSINEPTQIDLKLTKKQIKQIKIGLPKQVFDMNFDENLNVQDVILLVNLILGD